MPTAAPISLPVLSICIPTFNRADKLSVALDSIISLDADACIEVVVCDNASTDCTQSLVEGYAQKFSFIRYFRNELNIGYDRNLLRSMEHARGTYCWTLGSDDAVTPAGVRGIMEAIKDGPDFILCNSVNCDVHLHPNGELRFVETTDRLFDFSVADDIVHFLDKATMHASLFGYIGAMVFKRSRLAETPVNLHYIGSGYIQVSRALDILIIQKGIMRYLTQPAAMARRDNNDDVDGRGVTLRQYIDVQMFRRTADQYFSGSLEVHNAYKTFIRRIYSASLTTDIPTNIEFFDNFRHFFITDSDLLPKVTWQLKPVTEQARARLVKAGLFEETFNRRAILQIGFRGDFDMLSRPINAQTIGYDKQYMARFDAVHLPFDDSSFDVVWGCHCFDQMLAIVDTLREWLRVLKPDGFLVLSCDLGNDISRASSPTTMISSSFFLADVFKLLGEALPADDYRVVHCAQSTSQEQSTCTLDLVIQKPMHSLVDISQTLNRAMAFHQAGKLENAQVLYERILDAHPDDFAATHMLGVICFQQNDLANAETLLRKAISLFNGIAEAHYNLGCVLRATHQVAQAKICFENSLRIDAGFDLSRQRLKEMATEAES